MPAKQQTVEIKRNESRVKDASLRKIRNPQRFSPTIAMSKKKARKIELKQAAKELNKTVNRASQQQKQQSCDWIRNSVVNTKEKDLDDKMSTSEEEDDEAGTVDNGGDAVDFPSNDASASHVKEPVVHPPTNILSESLQNKSIGEINKKISELSSELVKMQETIEGDKTSREEMADIIRQQSVTITNLKKELETLSERNAKVDEQIQFVTNSLETAELQARHGQSEESTEDCTVKALKKYNILYKYYDKSLKAGTFGEAVINLARGYFGPEEMKHFRDKKLSFPGSKELPPKGVARIRKIVNRYIEKEKFAFLKNQERTEDVSEREIKSIILTSCRKERSLSKTKTKTDENNARKAIRSTANKTIT